MAFSGSGAEHWNLNGPFESANEIGGSGDGRSAVASAMQGEQPLPYVDSAVSVAVAAQVTSGESVKRKRGRPRKYAIDGSLLASALSPLSLSGSASSASATSPETRRPRGRPRGSGWRQRMARHGKWTVDSAGWNLLTHHMIINPGEDVTARIQSFTALQRCRTVTVYSATGTVSFATLRLHSRYVTYEGRYNIVNLQGSYYLGQGTGPRTGGMSILMAGPDGQLVGGAIGGSVIAQTEVTVMAFTFSHGDRPRTRNQVIMNEESSDGEKSPEAIKNEESSDGEKSPEAVTTATESSIDDDDQESEDSEFDVKQECSSSDA